jgi:hypothetical protein
VCAGLSGGAGVISRTGGGWHGESRACRVHASAAREKGWAPHCETGCAQPSQGSTQYTARTNARLRAASASASAARLRAASASAARLRAASASAARLRWASSCNARKCAHTERTHTRTCTAAGHGVESATRGHMRVRAHGAGKILNKTGGRGEQQATPKRAPAHTATHGRTGACERAGVPTCLRNRAHCWGRGQACVQGWRACAWASL